MSGVRHGEVEDEVAVASGILQVVRPCNQDFVNLLPLLSIYIVWWALGKIHVTCESSCLIPAPGRAHKAGQWKFPCICLPFRHSPSNLYIFL